MNRLDMDWSEPTFWERFGLLFLILFVLVIMSVIAAFFIGPDGILRMLGLKDDSIRGELSVTVAPENAVVRVDMAELEPPYRRSIEWPRATEHSIDAVHPAYLPEKLIIRIPADPQSQPEIIGQSENARLSMTDDGIEVQFNLVPEFLKVKIQSKPSGAAVEIDGIATNKTTPMEYELKSGSTVKITVEKSGYEKTTIDYDVPQRTAEKPVVLVLKKSQKPTPMPTPAGKKTTSKPVPAESTGTIQVKSPYPVDVYSGSKRLIQNRKDSSASVSTGKHTIRVVNPDYLLDMEQTVTVKAGKTHSIVIDRPGKMSLSSTPSGAAVIVDGREIGKTPGTFEAAPGLYKVEFKWSQCSETQSVWVKVVSGQTRRIPPVKGCL